MRLSALVVLVVAATFTMGCAGSRAYNLYSGTSPLDESVYGVDQSVTVASTTGRGLEPGSGFTDAGSSGTAAAQRAAVTYEQPTRVQKTYAQARTSTARYNRRTTLQSPPPPPPPPAIRAHRSSRPTSTPVRTASTVRAPTRSLPRAAPAATSAAARAPAAPTPTYSTYRAPSRPATVRAKPRRRIIAPIRKNNCPPKGLGLGCLGGT